MDACNISPALLVLPLSFLFRLARSLLFFLSFRRLLASSLYRPSVCPSVRLSFSRFARSFVRSLAARPPSVRPAPAPSTPARRRRRRRRPGHRPSVARSAFLCPLSSPPSLPLSLSVLPLFPSSSLLSESDGRAKQFPVLDCRARAGLDRQQLRPYVVVASPRRRRLIDVRR